MTAGRAALLGLMDGYLGVLMDPHVTLLEAHKLMYFMQETGEDLRLRITRGPYGPYAENLRHVFRALEGHMLGGYEDGGDDPNKQLTLNQDAVEQARAFLMRTPETKRRFERVSELVEGFETPFGLELLSTVHMVWKEERPDGGDLLERVHAWGPQKHKFSAHHVRVAHERLDRLQWLESN